MVAVVVPQWQLNTFLAAAEDLEILGLSKKCANIHIGDGDEFDAGLPELATNAAAVTTKRKVFITCRAEMCSGYEFLGLLIRNPQWFRQH
mgnify:CR=1 FL=1